jgi:hypothetical protein
MYACWVTLHIMQYHITKSTEYSPHYSGNKNKATKIILARFCYVYCVLAIVQITWHFCICCVQEWNMWNIHVCVYCFSLHNMVYELCDVSITNLAICDLQEHSKWIYILNSVFACAWRCTYVYNPGLFWNLEQNLKFCS